MKKMLFVLIILASFASLVIAQSDQYATQSEYVAVVTSRIPGDVLPPAISNGVNTRFDKNNPLTWSKLPYKLQEFGWVYEVGAPENKLSRYEVSMTTSAKGYITGLYNADGELVETRERSKNIPVPRYIMEALFESPYKDWKVVGNKEVINFYQNKDNPNAEQNFRLNIEKDNVRKKLAFKYEASTGKLQAYLIK